MSLNPEYVNHLLSKTKAAEDSNRYDEARSWLLVGKSLAPQNFNLNYEAYLMEKRRKSAEDAAAAFVPLARKFLRNVEQETTELANAVLINHFSKGKETEEQEFLLKIFTNLPKDIQMEILMQKSERSSIHYEKCQCSLLLVKLYPDTVHQHGADLLFSVLACESDAFSTFRKLLVAELVPAVLQLNTNFGSSPKLINLLNLCVEYYILVADSNATAAPITPNTPYQQHKSDMILENVVARLGNIFKLVDRVGQLLQWKICPFFNEALENSSLSGMDVLYQNLQLVFQNRHKYHFSEIAYVGVISFLACLTAYNELSTISKFGDVSKLHLVEVFCPHTSATMITKSQILITVSNDPSIGSNQTPLLNCFQVAVKIWQLLQAVKADPIEVEFSNILLSMKSLNFEKWNVFLNFLGDYCTYIGKACPTTDMNSLHAASLASLYCSTENFQKAAEFALNIVQEVSNVELDTKSNVTDGKLIIAPSKGEDFCFFDSHIYSLDSHDHFIMQRRVHFLSENRSELIHYATNVLIHCFENIIKNNLVILSHEDNSHGHLMTLLQLEWPSPPAEDLFLDLFERIKRKGSFSYYPYFDEFILEPDFLEHFASMSYDDSYKVVLDFFGNNAISNTPGSRRIATRGVNKYTKEEFREAMARQMAKNGIEKLENVIARFLTKHKTDILKCFNAFN